jgi:hypothetical protein
MPTPASKVASFAGAAGRRRTRRTEQTYAANRAGQTKFQPQAKWKQPNADLIDPRVTIAMPLPMVTPWATRNQRLG